MLTEEILSLIHSRFFFWIKIELGYVLSRVLVVCMYSDNGAYVACMDGCVSWYQGLQ